ncbi:hypothetical protein [Bradyrhizobium japonicum]|uniref:hypothetical protein n=1 Tax=Bradyrhizobium japonicum TaxID=375 RepID=UPI001E4E7033|nr:hypothetical protein [Bradyrhizobium japonicum]MCD9892074.1 hypothetical protein [Bradyrhizobium japonicum]WRJ83896.1 hypothetical protein R3F78_02935 [Bradyrhizobium japonicum]WRJ92865.1 hypothetical protein R3F77_00650 [Bradyrhizobium japonicum]WRK46716.1 hypothetical protein R3F73_00705 [Bradyrhizobium japonicum]
MLTSRTVKLVGPVGAGKTVLLMAMREYVRKPSEKKLVTFKEANDPAKAQAQLAKESRFPNRTKPDASEELEVLHGNFLGGPKTITIASIAGEDLADKGDDYISRYLSRDVCIWVQNPIRLEREFATTCFLGMIADLQRDSRFGVAGAPNVLKVANEALFSVYDEEGKDLVLASVMQLKHEAWPTIYGGFEPKAGSWDLKVQLRNGVIDPDKKYDENFDIVWNGQIASPDEVEVFGFLQEYVQRILDDPNDFNSRAAIALKANPAVPIVLTHIDTLDRIKLINVDRKLLEIVESWVGPTSFDRPRFIFARSLVSTIIHPTPYSAAPKQEVSSAKEEVSSATEPPPLDQQDREERPLTKPIVRYVVPDEYNTKNAGALLLAAIQSVKLPPTQRVLFWLSRVALIFGYAVLGMLVVLNTNGWLAGAIFFALVAFLPVLAAYVIPRRVWHF